MTSLQFILVTAVLLLLTLPPLNAARPSHTAGDQYKSLKDKAYFSPSPSEATVIPEPRFRGGAAIARHRFYVPPKKPSAEEKYEVGVPELQVGCGEGFVEVNQESTNIRKYDVGKKEKTKRAKREADANVRKRRDYYPWSRQVVEVTPLQSLTVWQQQPPVYQISRPYFIPIWGPPGRVPIYFPPQPLLSNPGYPGDNPRQSSYPAKGYLPPGPNQQASGGDGSSVNFENRYNFSNDDDDDRPIWDVDPSFGSNSVTQRPYTTTTARVIPTRRRRPSGRTTTPPSLVHSLGKTNATGINLLSAAEETKTRPDSPPILSSPPRRPSRPPRPASPSSSTDRSRQQNGPSKCVWAIISCCSGGTTDVSHSCFEQLGCPGAFWDTNPCDSEFAKAALASASNYFAN